MFLTWFRVFPTLKKSGEIALKNKRLYSKKGFKFTTRFWTWKSTFFTLLETFLQKNDEKHVFCRFFDGYSHWLHGIRHAYCHLFSGPLSKLLRSPELKATNFFNRIALPGPRKKSLHARPKRRYLRDFCSRIGFPSGCLSRVDDNPKVIVFPREKSVINTQWGVSRGKQGQTKWGACGGEPRSGNWRNQLGKR